MNAVTYRPVGASSIFVRSPGALPQAFTCCPVGARIQQFTLMKIVDDVARRGFAHFSYITWTKRANTIPDNSWIRPETHEAADGTRSVPAAVKAIRVP